METTRVKLLVEEYYLAKRRLEGVKKEFERAQIALEIAKDLEKELLHEIKMAQEGKNTQAVQYWRNIIDECYFKDKDIKTKEDMEKIKKEFFAKNEKLLMYYEKKLKTIKRLLGARLAQILENYEEKNILMGGEQSSTKVFYKVEEEEAEVEKREKERKSSATFDKM
jgi:hypothetical protein